MADFNRPATGEHYATHFQSIRDARESVAVGFDGTTDTNIPNNAIGWDGTNSRWKRFVGGAWQALCSLYEITVRRAITADSCTGNAATSSACTGNAATASLATNAQNLGGDPAADFIQTTDSRLTNSRTCNNTFDNAVTARSNLGVTSSSDINSALNLKANLASPALTGAPTTPTPSGGASNTQIVNAAWIQQEVVKIGPSIALSPYIQSGWTDNGSYAVPIYKGATLIAVDFYLRVSASPGPANGISHIYSLSDGGALNTFGFYMGYSEHFQCTQDYTLSTLRRVAVTSETPTKIRMYGCSTSENFDIRTSFRVYARDNV